MQSPLRVGIAGLGTVGSSVFQRLISQREALTQRTGRTIVVTSVSAGSRHKPRPIDLGTVHWYDDPVALAGSAEIDLFVELIGGAEGPAKASVEAALSAGKPVVTANKALLAAHGMALARIAEETHATLAFEASVAGGIPIVKTLREGLAGNQVERVEGILNGTCNYILTRMQDEGLAFSECLAEAQRLGYAEADPSFDVDGFDTAHKLAILSTLAFGVALEAGSLYVEGIRAITPADLAAADELGYRIKLLGIAQRAGGRIDGRVHPTMVPKTAALAQVGGVVNAVTVFADAVRELTLIGPGAGGEATASAVVADIADIAKGIRSAPLGLPVDKLERIETLPTRQHASGFYIRLNVQDRPGAVAAIAARMAERGISFESIMQRQPSRKGPARPGDTVSIVLVTYQTVEVALQEALDAVMADGYIAARPQVIRIDRR